MVIMKFNEKYGPRYITGETVGVICAMILRERILEGDYYEEDTIKAIKALNSGKAVDFITSRNHHEYEDFEVVSAEYADAAENYRIKEDD